MLKVRIAVVPVLVFAALTGLALWNISVAWIARFSFLWDTLLGVALGAGMGLLPGLTAPKQRPLPHAGLFWVAAFLLALLLCLQYMALITGQPLFGQQWLTLASGRSCVVEGAGLGYCTVQALRGS